MYVGSSCSHTKRKSAHKSNCNNEKSDKYNLPVYRYIRDNGGWDNWEFVLLEKFPCKDKQELVIRERYWFELLGAKLNKNYPQRTEEEYYEETKKKFLEKKKVYYDENKEEILEKGKQKVKCPCGSIFRKDGLSQHKRTQKHQNYLKNPDKKASPLSSKLASELT